MTTTRPLASSRSRLGRRSVFAALATAIVFVVSACTSAAPEASAPPTAVALPDTAAGQKAQWVLDTVNSDSEATAAEIQENIAAEMLEQVPASQMIAVFAQMGDAKPWTPTSVTEQSGGLVVLLHSDTAELQMKIAVDDQQLINGLLFQQPPADRTPAASWQELEKNVAALDADTSMTVTRVDADAAGSADRIVDIAGDETKPLGSVFKLYVLGAVADAVAAGTLSWDDNLIISDDTRSLPSGQLQDLPSGTLVTVRDAATKMIEISDNTATDLLIDRVGREAVEAQLAVMGHHDPALNTPFVKTREFFQLGWGAGADFGDARGAWADSTVEDRRAALAAMPGGVLDVASFDLSKSAWQEGIDWFASPADLVAAHVALQQKAATPAGEPVRSILSANPGLQFDPEVFPYVAFKGGSAPGVLAGSWLLERADGERFVITLQASSLDPADVADTALVFGNVTDAAALLADE